MKVTYPPGTASRGLTFSPHTAVAVTKTTTAGYQHAEKEQTKKEKGDRGVEGRKRNTTEQGKMNSRVQDQRHGYSQTILSCI